MNRQILFECLEVRAGPIKIENANCLMYIVKDLKKDEYETDNKGNEYHKEHFNYINTEEDERKR